MPSTDPSKYILHPHNALTVPQALLTAVCGLIVVFLMLAMLMVVIYVISWVVKQIEGKRKPAAAAPAKKAAPAPAAKPAAAPAAPAVDEGELVAVMMAAVAEESGMPMGSFQITNIAAAPAAPVAAPVAAPAPAPVAAPAPAPAPAPANKSASSSIRVDHEKLDHLMNLIGELLINRNRYAMIAKTLETSPADQVDVARVAQDISETT